MKIYVSLKIALTFKTEKRNEQNELNFVIHGQNKFLSLSLKWMSLISHKVSIVLKIRQIKVIIKKFPSVAIRGPPDKNFIYFNVMQTN